MEPASGDSSENLNDIIIKKELNIEFDEYQNILTDGLQIDSKQEVWEDLKGDISNCEALKRPTNRKNIKRENESQPAYPETSKKQKLLHQSSEDETVVIKNEPEIEFQNNSTETGQVTPSDGFSPFNVDYSLVPIGDQHIPCISWSSQSYCLLKALRFIFISELSEDIVNCAYIHPISVFDLQNKFLIHIDIKLSDTTFTSEDKFISIEEAHLYYDFLKTCSSKLSNNTKNSNKCGLIKMMDESVIPYVVRYNSKLLPLCYFKNRRDLQLDLNRLKIETVSGWELSYLKFCCIVRGTASGELFESDACDVASLSNIAECFPLGIKFEDYWPRSDSEFELLMPSRDLSFNNPQFHYLMEGISTSLSIPKNINGKNNAQSKSAKMASSDDEYDPHSEVDSVADSDVDSDVHFNDYSSEHSEIDNEVEADVDEFYQAKMDPPGDEYTVNKNYKCTDDGNSESERISLDQNNLHPRQYDNWTKTQSIIPDFGFDSASSGIKKDIGDTPIDIFRSIWTGEVKKLLIENTNAYGKKLSNSSLPKAKYCRLTKFNEMNDMELENFFGLCLLGGQLGFPTLRKLFSRDPLYYHPVFSYVMSGRRFENILSCLNCSTTNNDRMSKISPLVDIIVSNFQNTYSPSEEIYLDEPFLLHQGRLWLQRHMKGKKASYGIKFYELCSPNGYIHNLEIYRGRLFNNEPRGTRIDAGVLSLMNPFLHKGHHIFMDSYYNNISLCTELLEKRTHTTGIIHADRRGNPGEITNKRIKKGEHIWLRKNNIYISKWHDSREVLSITTKHHPRLIRKKNKYGVIKVKPIEVVEYTKFMDGVDRADQLISFYSCPRKTIRWYKKIIFHLLDTTVFNSWILYRIKIKKAVSFVQFREILIKSLLGIAHLANGKDLTTTCPTVVNSNNTISLQLENHVLEKIPVPINYRRKSYFLRCRWCSKENKRTNTSWRCPICPNKPPLCLGNCFKYFHAR